MNYKHSINFIAWRFYLVLSIIALIILSLIWRVFDLTILKQHFLLSQSNIRVLRLVSTPAFRGMILDRNGFPLAVSTTVYSAWMNPHEFKPSKQDIKVLAHILNLNSAEIATRLHKYQQQKQEFVYLKRDLAPEVAQQIKALALSGLYLQREYRRYYPEGAVTAHVVGFTNVDDQGQEGLELAYNDWLKGKPGKKWVIKDRLGRAISDIQTVQNAEPGHDLYLSVDRRIQYLAYRELIAGIKENQAASGSAVVLDTETGEVLAMVNYPTYNPNDRPTKVDGHFRNRAVTDTFEPGSTIKAFTVASGLESNKIQPDTIINTSPGWMRLDHQIVRDEGKNNGAMSIAQILQKSSNMGAAKIVLSLPQDQLWNLLHRVGFGEITGVGFPGEQSGSLINRDRWGSFMLATLSFGYGLSITPLQLTRAYAILANEGIKKPIYLLRVKHIEPGQRVLDARTAKQMLSLLETVTKGTGKAATVPGFRVAGKTGTAWIIGPNGYLKHRYNASYVGIAPLSQPRLVVAVVIHDPRGKEYEGGKVSAPVFEKIMEGVLRILAIPPDEMNAKT